MYDLKLRSRHITVGDSLDQNVQIELTDNHRVEQSVGNMQNSDVEIVETESSGRENVEMGNSRDENMKAKSNEKKNVEPGGSKELLDAEPGTSSEGNVVHVEQNKETESSRDSETMEEINKQNITGREPLDVQTMSNLLDMLMKNLADGNKKLKEDLQKQTREIGANLEARVINNAKELEGRIMENAREIKEDFQVRNQELETRLTENNRTLNENLKEEIKSEMQTQIAGVNRRMEEMETLNNSRIVELTNIVQTNCSDIVEVSQRVTNNTEKLNTLKCNQVGLGASLEANMTEIGTRVDTMNSRITHIENSSNIKIRDVMETVENLKEQMNNRVTRDKEGDNHSINSEQLPGTSSDHNSSTAQSNVPMSTGRNVASGNFNFLGNELILPKFSNQSNEHPLRYLRDLESYCEIRGVPQHLWMAVVRCTVKGQVTSWLEVQIGDDMSYDIFRKLFLEQYWGEDRQIEIRSIIMNGKYSQKGKRTMANTVSIYHTKRAFLIPKYHKKSLCQ